MRRVVLLSAIIGQVALAAPSHAKPGVQTRVLSKLSLNFRTKSPTFYGAAYPTRVDRDRLLYLGRGIWHEDHIFHFFRLSDRKVIRVPAPVVSYYRAQPKLFPLGARPSPRVRPYMVDKLLFYDRRDGQAGLVVKDGHVTRGGGRHLYLHWDLKQRRVVRTTVLGVRGASGEWISIKPIGYSPKRRTAYVFTLTKLYMRSAQPAKYRIDIWAMTAQRSQRILSVSSRRRGSTHPLLYDPVGERALFVQYGELRGSNPRGLLFDLRRKRLVRRVAVPRVAYGKAFDPKRPWLYVYSNLTGELWVIDTRNGRRLRTLQVGVKAHSIAIPFPDTIVVVRNKGLQFVEVPRLRKTQFVPITRFFTGFSHLQGSVTVGRTILLKNGRRAVIVNMRRTGVRP